MRIILLATTLSLLIPVVVEAIADEPYGLAKRTPWITSNFHGRPEPPPPFRAPRVYPNIHFEGPTVLTGATGSKRWFVAERSGKVYSFHTDAHAAKADLFLDCTDLAKQISEREKQPVQFQALYGLTFDPQFEKNRCCYVCYVVRRRQAGGSRDPDGTRVVRLHVSDSDPPRCEIASEKTIITWLQGGHNGGCLKFGPDGFLYISTGDGGEAFPPDGRNTGQDLSDLLSSVLRIDVHPADANAAYTIPADNPFVTVDKARGENWAYGLRNPWKMSFDRLNGELWAGDVGWELWELVYRVRKGENYGWSLMEGRQPVHTEEHARPDAHHSPHCGSSSHRGRLGHRRFRLSGEAVSRIVWHVYFRRLGDAAHLGGQGGG